MTINECRVETHKHIERVRKYLRFITDRITTRGVNHDASKLEDPQVQVFAEHTQALNQVEYGSEEYQQHLAAMKPALEHHYAVNRHHPEHFTNGVNDMTLIDVVEMFADWKAASERTQNGNLLKSIELNAERFHLSDQLKEIFINTAKTLDDAE